MTDPTNEPEPPAGGRRLRFDIAVYGGLWLALYAAIQVGLASRWNRDTALGLLQNAGPAQIALGTLSSFMAIWLLPVALGFVLAGVRRDWRLSRASGIAVHALIFAGVLIEPLGGYVSAAVFGGIFAGWRVIRRKIPRSPNKNRIPTDWELLGGVWLVSLLVVSSVPWFPTEFIQISGRKTPTIGYVVDLGDQWTTILDAKTRLLARYPSSEIEGRSVCRLSTAEGWSQTSLVELLFGRTHEYPQCSTLEGSK